MTDATTDATELPIEQAAARLGITVDALRLRIRRGKSIKGHKRYGQWYVTLPTDAASDANGHDRDANGRATDATSDANVGATIVIYDRLVAAKDAEIARLVEQLATKDEQLRQANVLLARLTEKPIELAPVQATPAPAPSPPAASEPSARSETPAEQMQQPRRSWWQWLLTPI